jgi:large subunit ribosomal protein L35Ae
LGSLLKLTHPIIGIKILITGDAKMQGKITDFRGSIKSRRPNQVIVAVPNVAGKARAQALVGKTVVWETESGKKINGKISRVHGGNGKVIARFEKGLPGQCLGTKLTFKA